MPDTTKIKQFVKNVNDRKTTITRRLANHFANPADFKTHPHLPDLQTPGALDPDPLPDWAEQELANAGLKPNEITHVAKWPPGEKEKFREALVAAISADPDNSRKLEFFWELYDGDASVTQVVPPLPGAGDITVTFRSPSKKVRKSIFTHGEIFVDI